MVQVDGISGPGRRLTHQQNTLIQLPDLRSPLQVEQDDFTCAQATLLKA